MLRASMGPEGGPCTIWLTYTWRLPKGQTPSIAATPETPPAPRMSTANRPVRFRLGCLSVEPALMAARAATRRTLISTSSDAGLNRQQPGVEEEAPRLEVGTPADENGPGAANLRRGLLLTSAERRQQVLQRLAHRPRRVYDDAVIQTTEARSPQQPDPVVVVAKFNEAFARGDVDAVMALMTDDCIFENTFPAPDGERHVGAKAVRQFWNDFFASTDLPRFETEELIAVDDRVVTRWRFSWGSGTTGGHVRGADVFRVRDGKVAEKLSYVKG